MKHATSILAIVVAAFVVGCQDNNITDPTIDTSSGGKQLSKILPVGTIRLNTILHEPRGFNTFTEITGQVEYTTTIVPRDPIPPNPQFAVLVTLALDANLKPFGSEEPVWRVSNSSRDELAENDGVLFLEKSYKIEGRNDGVSLRMQFQVTEAGVTLARMWLARLRWLERKI